MLFKLNSALLYGFKAELLTIEFRPTVFQQGSVSVSLQ